VLRFELCLDLCGCGHIRLHVRQSGRRITVETPLALAPPTDKSVCCRRTEAMHGQNLDCFNVGGRFNAD
jgi:hypothetical protein